MAIRKFSQIAAAGADFDGNDFVMGVQNGTTDVLFSKDQLFASLREVLTADRTYYVRTDGNDNNNGLTDSAGGAFLTIQKALDVIKGDLDLGGRTVTVQVGNGTYTNPVSLSGPFIGAGAVNLRGDPTTPSNVVISTTSSNCVSVSSGGSLNIAGFKLTAATSGNGLSVATYGRISMNGNMEFGSVVTAHMSALTDGQINTGAQNYSITAGADYHYLAQSGGQITDVANTVTLTGTPAFAQQFAHADSLGLLTTYSQTFSGAATGTRYNASSNAVINTNGGGANYYPGNAAGSTATGGQYV